MGPMPSPGGKGRSGPIEDPIMDFPPIDNLPRYDLSYEIPPGVNNPPVENPILYGQPDYQIFGGEYGGGFGGGMGAARERSGGAKMNMGGQTAYPSQNVLSSYMMG